MCCEPLDSTIMRNTSLGALLTHDARLSFLDNNKDEFQVNEDFVMY